VAIFPSVEIEKEVQVNDKTRIAADKTFVSKDEAAITLVEVEPESGNGYIDVTGTSSRDWYLDWEYSGTSRTVTVTVRVTTDGAPVIKTDTIEVLSVADDYLFSSDKDLTAKESDILKYVPTGRNSFLNVHRKAQDIIISDFRERGITDTNGDWLTKEAFVDIEEVRQWSLNLALSLIFQDLSNAVEDEFDKKSKFYESEMLKHKNASIIRFDEDGDGTIDASEGANIQTVSLIRG
jgi:hypothetical protein